MSAEQVWHYGYDFGYATTSNTYFSEEESSPILPFGDELLGTFHAGTIAGTRDALTEQSN